MIVLFSGCVLVAVFVLEGVSLVELLLEGLLVVGFVSAVVVSLSLL